MSRWYTLHIKNEILFWFILLSLLPLLVLTSVNYYYQKSLYEEEAKGHLQLILKEKSEAIDNHLSRIGGEIEVLATSQAVKEMLLSKHPLKEGHQESRDYFVNLVARHQLHDLMFVDKDGTIIYSVKKESDLGTNLNTGAQADTNLGGVYRKCIEQLETQISDFRYYEPSNKEALFMATPVYANHTFIGVIVFQINITKINELFLNQEGMGESGEVYTAKLTHDNRVVSTTPLRYRKNSVSDNYQFPNAIELPIYKAVNGESNKAIVYDYRDKEVVAAWGYIPILRWGIVAQIDHDEILAPVAQLRFYSILILFFVGIGIVIAILSAIKHIVQPIERLANTMKNFSKGKKIETSFDADMENEIGELSRNFQEMSIALRASQETIQKYADELELKVQIRTQELENANAKIDLTNKNLKRYITIIDTYIITSTTNLSGTITYVSQAFCAITGYTQEELIGRKHNIVRHPDMPVSLYSDLWATIRSGKIWQGEIKNLCKDGSYYWVHSTITPIMDENGEIIEYTSIRQDITDKKRIEELSITDGLTQIYNRRHFNEMLPKMIDSAKRNNELFCFLMMDIDHFKLYNDTYGHQMGDDVLIKVAHVFKKSLRRADDYCFRLGGEEFGILFKTQSHHHGVEFAASLCKEIEDLKIQHEKNSASAYVTASIGLIILNAQEITDHEVLYKHADDLLYRAKESGRNRVISNEEGEV